MNDKAFPPQVRLMLLAAQAGLAGSIPTPEHRAAMRETAAQVEDWTAFVATTVHHRIVPRVLPVLPYFEHPPFVLDRLKLQETANKLHLMRQLQELNRLERAFHESGFSLLPLKGTRLSVMLYGEITGRHCGDLDCLIEERGLDTQIGLMEKLGYRLTEPEAPMTPKRLDNYRKFWKGLTFFHDGTESSVDLHWRLFNNPHHGANRLLDPPDFGAGGHTLGAQLLYSAAHGAWDSWHSLKGLVDVAACLHLLSADSLRQALERASALGLLSQVSSAVRLAQQWLGADVEEQGLLPADDPFHVAMQARVEQRLWQHQFRPARLTLGAASAFAFEMSLVPGVQSALHMGRRYVWRPRIWSRHNLPDRWIGLTPLLGVVMPPAVRKRSRPGNSKASAAAAQQGLLVWLTGLSGAGKSTLAAAVIARLQQAGIKAEFLDADEVRPKLCGDLGFSRADREESVRRIGFVAGRLCAHHVVTLVAAMSPYRAGRDQIRQTVPAFLEVFVDAPVAVCEERDPKGLYRRFRLGEIRDLSGLDGIYEPPLTPEVHCHTDLESLDESAAKVFACIIKQRSG